MSKYKTLLYNLVVFPGEKKEKNCFPIYFLSEKDKKLGQLFITGKLKTENKEFKKTIDYLVNLIENNFLNQVTSNPEIALENVLRKANEEWQLEISKHKHSWDESELKRQLKNLDLLIGVVKENKIYFVHVGNARAFLIRDDKIVDILSSLKEKKEIDLFNLFTNIVSGHLKANDHMFFCFSDILDYFSLEKIKRIVKNYIPSRAGQYFRDLLQSASPEKIFVATLIGIYSKKIPEETIPISQTPITHEDSMQQLVLRQQNAEKFIHPSVLPPFTALLKNFIFKVKQIINSENAKVVKAKFSKILSFLYKKFFKKTSLFIFKNIINKLPKISKHKIAKIKLPPIKLPGIRKERKIWGFIPKKNKSYLIVSFITIFVLIFLGAQAYF